MFLILFIILFVSEVFAFIEMGGQIGGFATFLLVILSGVYGLSRLKFYTSYMSGMRGSNQNDSVNRMFHGLCGIFGGVLLLIPGFITDGLGLLLIIPFVRVFLRTFILDSILGAHTFGLVDTDDLKDMKNFYKDKTPSETKNSSKKRAAKKEKNIVDADFEIVDVAEKKR